MQSCSCLLFSFLLIITVLHCSVESFRVRQQPQHVGRPLVRPRAAFHLRPGGVKREGEELTAKLLLLDDMVRMENDVMEPKRKRSFPGNNAPLDRLSISSMETKHATNKQSRRVATATSPSSSHRQDRNESSPEQQRIGSTPHR